MATNVTTQVDFMMRIVRQDRGKGNQNAARRPPCAHVSETALSEAFSEQGVRETSIHEHVRSMSPSKESDEAEKARRPTFTVEYKRPLVKDADACSCRHIERGDSKRLS